MSSQSNHLYAYKKAMLSVAPEDLVQFSKTIEKNISEKQSSKKSKSSHRDKVVEKRKSGSIKKSDKKKSTDKKSKKAIKKLKKSKKDKKDKTSSKKNKTKVAQDQHQSNDDDVSEVEEKYLDLNLKLKPLKHYVKDPKKLLAETLTIVKEDKLKSLVPDLAKHFTHEEIKDKFADYLDGMSSTRIKHILEGRQMNSSSDTDSSQEDKSSLKLVKSLQANHVDSTTSNLMTSSLRHSDDDDDASSGDDDESLKQFADDEVIEEEVEIMEEVMEEDSEEQIPPQQSPHETPQLSQSPPQAPQLSQLEQLEHQLRLRALRSLNKARKESEN